MANPNVDALSAELAKVAERWFDRWQKAIGAARVANYTSFVSPVSDITDALTELNPDAGSNPILFPAQDVLDRLVQFPLLDPDDEEKFDERFSEITLL